MIFTCRKKYVEAKLKPTTRKIEFHAKKKLSIAYTKY